jgi:two-component system sensor histidine kinase PilS (NtrC family)
MPPRRRLIILLRPLIATIVLGPEIYFRKNDPFLQVFPLATVILLSYFASLIFYIILKTGKRGTVYDFAQTVTDTLMVNGLVAFTGSINSPYTPLFFLNIIEGSYFLRPAAAFTIATLAAASIVAMGVVWMNQSLSPEPDASIFNIEVVRYFLKLFIFTLFFYLTSALTTYFHERFAAGSRALEEVRMTTDDILEIVDSGIITIDTNGRLKQINPAAKQILSLQQEYIVGRSFREIFPSRLRDLSELINGFSGDLKVQRRLVLENEEGDEIPVMVTISAMRRENVDYGGILVNIINLREEEEVQKRLRTADRMKTALELSAGIAHEIRNPLASIQGALEVIMREIKTHEKIGRLADLVLKEAERLNNIIERFLQYVRIPKRERKHAVISHILRDVVDLVKNHPKYNKAIEIKTDFTDSECTVFIDPEQIKQVFLNILLNAFSAVGKEGKVFIQFHKKHGYCGVSFQDSGIGIDEEDLEKVFQPFFSKNPEGSGLGLSVAHRIVEQHRGEINVVSAKGKGSTFTVWLPLSTET